MLDNGKSLFFLILLEFSQNIQGWYVDFETFHQVYNPDIIKYADLHITNNTNRSVINGAVILNKNINQFDISFYVTSSKRNGNPWTLLNVTLNSCDFIENSQRKQLSFPYLLLDGMRAATPNFPKKCPIKKHTEIQLKKFSINSNKMSLYFPELSYNCKFVLRENRTEALKVLVAGSVKSNK